MRLLVQNLLVGCLAVSVAQGQVANGVPNRLTAGEKEAGWELLFDGQTGHGWRSPSSDHFPDGFWIVEDGFLKGRRVGNRATDLTTVERYRSFELTFEWKIAPGGNSGVKYFVGRSAKLVFEDGKAPTPEGETTPGSNAFFSETTSGFEYQMIDDERHPDKDNSKTRSGSLYQFFGPAEKLARPAGQLNQSRIVVKGTFVEHWLNGIKTASMDWTSEEFRSALDHVPGRSRRVVDYLNQDCPIALQSHTGEVWFRSFKLRRLPAVH
jgi:hypothetical protein